MSEEKPKKVTENQLKRVFAHVLQGYTTFKNSLLGEQESYIKHLNIFDNVETDTIYEEYLSIAKEKDLPTEKKQKEYLNNENLWTEKEDKELVDLKIYITNLKDTKSKLFLKSQIDGIVKEIEEAEQKFTKLTQDRDHLTGFTAERYAAKRSNESYIQKAIYKNKDFEEQSMPDEMFDDLSDKELSEIILDYNKATEHTTLENLKKISLLPFFCNYYYLCEDNPQVFYGKPVVDLSFYQAELFAFGRYFKALAQDSKVSPPSEIRNDPDKLIEFYEMRKNADEVIEKTTSRAKGEGGATTLVGATKKDLEALGYAQESSDTINLSKEAADKGGTLSMDDFIDLHS